MISAPSQRSLSSGGELMPHTYYLRDAENGEIISCPSDNPIIKRYHQADVTQG